MLLLSMSPSLTVVLAVSLTTKMLDTKHVIFPAFFIQFVPGKVLNA
jgi:hypothetical protein